MHAVLRQVFDNRLIFPPVRSPRRILDCGCGAGDWAIDVATQYPDCEVRASACLVPVSVMQRQHRPSPASAQQGEGREAGSSLTPNLAKMRLVGVTFQSVGPRCPF